ncbi:MAG: hypothetical protein ACRET5_18425 [Steroidobacteraceae bacterium]
MLRRVGVVSVAAQLDCALVRKVRFSQLADRRGGLPNQHQFHGAAEAMCA